MTSAPVRTLNLPLVVHAQYVRDLSFENPGGLGGLKATGTAPDMDISVHLDAHPIPDEKTPALYEVVLRLSVRATRDKTPLFLAEVEYGVAVSMAELPEPQRHPALLVEVPRLAFPFVRQIVADLVQGGGFPPLLLTPPDFAAMYMAQFAQKQPTAPAGETVQ